MACLFQLYLNWQFVGSLPTGINTTELLFSCYYTTFQLNIIHEIFGALFMLYPLRVHT